MDPSTPTMTLSPLGEPLVLESARSLREDPLPWHLKYWLNLLMVAICRGDNVVLTLARIDREQSINVDQNLRDLVRFTWPQYQVDNRDNFHRYWNTLTVHSVQAQPFIRDILRMLVNKDLKMRAYLEQQEEMLTFSLRALQFDGARMYFDKLEDIHRNLRVEGSVEQAGARVAAQGPRELAQAIARAQDEQAAAAADRNQFINGLIGTQAQGGGQNAPAPAVNDPHRTQPAGQNGQAPRVNGIGVNGHISDRDESDADQTDGGESADTGAGEHPQAPTENGFGIHGQTPEEHESMEHESVEQESEEQGSDEQGSDEEESSEDE